jgi:hypothetical protein
LHPASSDAIVLRPFVEIEMKVSITSLAAFGCSLCARADASQTSLFGQTYAVQRFDYFQSIRFANPQNPTQLVGLLDSEGACFLANGHVLMTSRQMNMSPANTYRNFVVEARIDADPSGHVTGVSYVRTVLVNDASPPPAGLGDPFNLDPKGVTINSTASGIGAGGNIVIASGNQFLYAYDFASGAWIPPGDNVNPPVIDLEDLAFVPDVAPAAGKFYEINQTGTARTEVFSSAGAWQFGFPVATFANPPSNGGAPKGIAFVPDSALFPLAFRGKTGVVLIGLDQSGPGLQAFDRTGSVVGYEPLDPSVFVPGSQALQIEGVAADPATGRVMLVQQGSHGVNDYVWILSPDCNGNGIADAIDIASSTSADLNGDAIPDECEPIGTPNCFGDGADVSATPCPCANFGSLGHGCASSVNASGALLESFGHTSVDPVLATDTVVLAGFGMPSSATSVFLQGASVIAHGVVFGDGVRCAGGMLVRLAVKVCSGGAAHFPETGDLSLSQRGGVVPGSGATREYQTYYRNPDRAFCPPPLGNTWNVTNGITLVW